MRLMNGCAISVGVVVLAGCERVVDLNLRDGPRRLVVEARLERVLGAATASQSVKLSTTSPYFSESAPPAARGAIIRVTDDLSVSTLFAESPIAGTYTTNALMVERGRRYTLRIDFEGQQFEAIEETRTVPPIDSLYFEKPRPGRFAGTEGVRATIDFIDPGNVRNFYLWDQYVNGVRQLGPDSAFKLRIVAPDDALNGLPILGFQPFEGIDIKVGNEVLIRQIGLSESMYRYYFALSDQVGEGGSPFSVPSASIRGNVANRTVPASPALGYFSVSEVAEKRATRRE